jgi:ribonuclease HI
MLEPVIQSFETELIWLYKRYKYRIPKNDPLKDSQYTLPIPIGNFLHNTFHITHSYFSSPITCSLTIDNYFSPFPRDCIFGSLGNSFQYKWQGIGYAHPHTDIDMQKAIHWTRLSAQADPDSLTIIIVANKNWYHTNTAPHTTFPDVHTLIYFQADTITYKEPTIPTALNHSRIEPSILYIYCIHHQNNPIRPSLQLQNLNPILQNLNIQHYEIHPIGPIPPHTPVNPNAHWHKSPYPPSLRRHTISSLPLPTYATHFPPKFQPKISYYTDGSFIPPKENNDGLWTSETAGYGIYNFTKNLAVSQRLPGLQNILRAELMVIHHAIKIIIQEYPHEPTYIFTDSLNSLYLLNTQLKHPTLHNNHPDKTILASIISMISAHTQPLSLFKVRAHTHIYGNDQADQLAKAGNTLPHHPPLYPFEHAHSTPYYLHKDSWFSMANTPYKGPIRNLHRYITKQDTENNLQKLANSFPNICK